MRGVIRLNDPTSRGGRVVSASPNSKVMLASTLQLIARTALGAK